MTAVAVLIRAGIRGRWRSLAVLAVVTTLACGFVLTAANGTRRTETSWSRLEAATDAPDVLASSGVAQVDSTRATVAARDDVAAVGAFTWIPASIDVPAAEGIGLFGALGDGFGDTVWRPLMLRGRLANPDRVDEITINEAYAELTGVDVGDHVNLTGPGIDQPATVVGIHRSSLDIGPNGGAPTGVATRAFMDRWWPTLASLPELAEARPAIGIRFDAGTDVDAALHDLAKSLPADAGMVGPSDLDSDVLDGLRSATTAYWVLTIASAIGSLVLLSLVVVRVLRSHADDSEVLDALGVGAVQRAAAAWVPVAAAIAVGVALAPVVATAASPLVRTGFAKLADPAEGVWVDRRVVLLSTLLLAAGLLTMVAVVARRVTSVRRGARTTLLRSTRIDRLGIATPAAVLGANAAFGGMRASTRRLARSTLLASIGTVALVVATMVWLSSASQLTDDFALQGWGFDAVAQGSAGSLPPSATRALAARDDVVAMSAYAQRIVTYRSADADVFSLTGVKQSIPLVLRRGRAPAGPNEVAAGPLVLRATGRTVGDQLVLPGDDGPVSVTIVGEVVFPALGNNGFGGAILMTEDTAQHFGVPVNSGLLLELAPGADVGAMERAAGDTTSLSQPFSPPNIVRLRDVRGIAAALATFFAVFGLAVFAFGMVTGGHHQRRDLAVMRAVGLRRRGVLAAFRWQGLIVLAASIVVGAPLGAALGRTVWRVTSRNLGTLDAWRIPPVQLAVAALVALGASLAVAAVSARGPARERIAVGLRAE